MKTRCAWCTGNELMEQYHDEEWGTPLHDDQRLFEFLILEGAQAGLSWLTVLKKREGYRMAFDNFDAKKIAVYTDADVERLMADPGIIRNRLKIQSAILNARAYLVIKDEFGSFDRFIWQFTGGVTFQSNIQTMNDIPAKTALSDAMSKELLKRGFKFVGSTICYAFMQATGMVNDHAVDCHRYASLC